MLTRASSCGLFLLSLLFLAQCAESKRASGKVTPRRGEAAVAENEVSAFQPPASTKILFGAPVAGQSTNYSCGAAAMQSALAYYGLAYSEEHLMKEMGTNAKDGTDHHRMAAYANKVGVKAEVRTNVPIAEVAQALSRDQLVVIECQAHEDRPGKDKDYTNVWDSGHYMVVIGLDDKTIYFMDPSLGGYRGYLPIPEFMVRWHDLGGKNEKLYQTAIFLDAKPAPVSLPHSWSKVP